MAPTRLWLLILVVAAGLAGACDPDKKPTGRSPAPAASGVSASPAAQTSAAKATAQDSQPTHLLGDAVAGAELVERFECARCHDLSQQEPPEPGATPSPVTAEAEQAKKARHCVNCHKNIVRGEYDHRNKVASWKVNVAPLTAVPPLLNVGERFGYSWLVNYLLNPHDLRPNLQPSMPRLALSEEEARNIASFLVKGQKSPKVVELNGVDLEQGRKLLEQKACGTCHQFGGVSKLPEHKMTHRDRETRAAVMLAPDLRFARERMSGAALVRWIRDPQKVNPGSLMPTIDMSDDEAKAIAGYIMRAELTPAVGLPGAPKELKLLERKVGFEEVAKKVLYKTCRHCHGDPNMGFGDGGPGNTGGFGFKARGLSMSDYTRVSAGYVDDKGERHSVFEKMSDGTPRLVASMLARHDEIAGRPRKEIRGMPLGFPPIPIDDIALVATWISQGRPR